MMTSNEYVRVSEKNRKKFIENVEKSNWEDFQNNFPLPKIFKNYFTLNFL